MATFLTRSRPVIGIRRVEIRRNERTTGSHTGTARHMLRVMDRVRPDRVRDRDRCRVRDIGLALGTGIADLNLSY